jgi:aspartyl-tRNA(Asn)/glutamyl-tRNA(Gln) amidotransferase subunit C
MIDDKTFASILSLCRFRLNEEEQKRFRSEIGDILAYMDRLNEVDTSGADIDLGKALPPEAFRADAAVSGLPAEGLEGLSPHFADGLFLTPPILEELDEGAGGQA